MNIFLENHNIHLTYMSEQIMTHVVVPQSTVARDLNDILLNMVRESEQYHEQLRDSLARFIMEFDTSEESCLVFDTSHITPTIYTGSQCIARATGRERRHKFKRTHTRVSACTSTSASTSTSTSASTSEDDETTDAKKNAEFDTTHYTENDP